MRAKGAGNPVGFMGSLSDDDDDDDDDDAEKYEILNNHNDAH